MNEPAKRFVVYLTRWSADPPYMNRPSAAERIRRRDRNAQDGKSEPWDT
jgi:hypothetical protein